MDWPYRESRLGGGNLENFLPCVPNQHTRFRLTLYQDWTEFENNVCILYLFGIRIKVILGTHSPPGYLF
jgi:hypothetical protein